MRTPFVTEIVLWFTKYQEEVQLERTLYVDSFGAEFVAVRGKTPGAYKKAGSFQWTPAVKALTIIFLTALKRNLKQIKTLLPLLEGGRGSLASSLDYALSKQPELLFNMFGSDDQGNASLKKLLFRSNSGMRRAGSVGISLNEQLLDPQHIKIYVENKLITDSEELGHLTRAIINAEQDKAQIGILIYEEDNNSGDRCNPLWALGRSSGPIYAEGFRSTDTEVLNSNNDIQPVAESNLDNIYLFEQLQFPSSYATRDRLIHWQKRLKSPGEPNPPAILGRIVQAKHLFEELTYLTCDDRTRSQFEQWIAQMMPERDAEWGLDREKDGRVIPGFLRWIQEHNTQFTPGGFYRTFFWRDRLTKEMVATLTIAPDDRGVRERHQLPGDGQLGGINVRWDLRYRGIGKYLSARIDQHILEFANRECKSKLIHTCNYNFDGAPHNILQRMNYVQNPIGLVKTDFGILPMWSREYRK